MGGCVSGELPDSFLPQVHLDGSFLDVSIRKSATRILALRIRQQDQARIRQLQQQYGNKKNVAIEVTVKVTTGAMCKEETQHTQRDARRGRNEHRVAIKFLFATADFLLCFLSLCWIFFLLDCLS